MKEQRQVCAVVLAAGKGTRMKSELPKVATLLQGKPLVCHVIESLRQANIQKIIVVVGFKREVVQSILEPYSGISFVEQKEQLGTGHALLMAEPELKDFHGDVLVCCGDVPLISGESFQSLTDFHKGNENSVTVLSAKVENPTGYGRLVREKEILKYIVEEKDSNAEEKKISEINTGTYVFDCPSVFQNLKEIGTNNAQGEYYLPDLVKIYNQKGFRTGAMILKNSLESTGVNSPEDLQYLHKLLDERKIAG